MSAPVKLSDFAQARRTSSGRWAITDGVGDLVILTPEEAEAFADAFLTHKFGRPARLDALAAEHAKQREEEHAVG